MLSTTERLAMAEAINEIVKSPPRHEITKGKLDRIVEIGNGHVSESAAKSFFLADLKGRYGIHYDYPTK